VVPDLEAELEGEGGEEREGCEVGGHGAACRSWGRWRGKLVVLHVL
jgi:hypothetical protein